MWVLIMVWSMSTGSNMNHYGITTQEFSTAESCRFASTEVMKLHPRVKMVCIPKGEVKK